MGKEQIYKDCERCNGTGIINQEPSGSYTCTACGGSGKMPFADYGNKVFRTYQILEVTDSTEYNALSATQKSTYALIISCGAVDLSDDTAIKAKLWAMFGEGSATRTALIALIG